MRVLVADDEALIRLGLKAMLQEMGHEVVLAADGHEALSKANQMPIDFAILDVNMPFLDGIQLAKRLIQIRSIPIVILSAYSDPTTLARATELPIHGYLVKPVQAGAIEAAMMLAQRRFAEIQLLQNQAQHLLDTLEGRKLVDKAKAVLIKQGLTEEESYLKLQRLARDSRRSMASVAKEILSQRSLGG
jgi:AmiR/NasT family two-component response regulator